MSYQMWDTSDPDTILIDYELTDQEMGEDGSLKFGELPWRPLLRPTEPPADPLFLHP